MLIRAIDEGGRTWTLPLKVPFPIIADESRFQVSKSGEHVQITLKKAQPDDPRAQKEKTANDTTLMIRCIPRSFEQCDMMSFIDSKGFAGRYDFFYLPMDARGRANRGFAYINLMSTEAA